MIHPENLVNCCGCGACANVCPVRCISMREDAEGFLYPVVDRAKCRQCGLCEKACVCSVDSTAVASHSVQYACGCYTRNADVRRESSSGGVFYELARNIFQRGGYVFGVRMGESCQTASFTKAESEADLKRLLGSKYLQAVTGDVYREVKRELDAGRAVLFSGTPCQINALRLYLRKDYAHLFCVDVICHGTPSPKLWRMYVDYLQRSYKAVVTGVNFRCKETGWRNFGLQTESSSRQRLFIPKDRDPYMRMFLGNYSLRPSCYDCASKAFRLSDLTIGDFWGIEHVLPALDDGNGTSLVFIRTDKGRELFACIQDCLQYAEVPYARAIRYNLAEYESVSRPEQRNDFFQDMNTISFESLSKKYCKDISIYRRIRRKVGKIWKKMTGVWGSKETI